MPSDHHGRTTRTFRRLAANLKAQRNPTCVICQGDKGPIRYDLDNPHPLSFSVEHLASWSTHPHLREEPTNLAPSHLTCNTSNGNSTRINANLTTQLGQRSRNW